MTYNILRNYMNSSIDPCDLAGKIEAYQIPRYFRNVLENNRIKIDTMEITENSLLGVYPKVRIEGALTPLQDSETTKMINLKRIWVEHTPNKVIFNPPATIVFWTDDTKTVVKCGEEEEFDPEKGLAMAFAKKYLGNQGNYYNTIRFLLNTANYQYDKEQSYIFDPFKKIKESIFGKSIPKVVIKRMRGKHYDQPYFTCPVCEDEIQKSGARYCANCGQRLIWEEK